MFSLEEAIKSLTCFLVGVGVMKPDEEIAEEVFKYHLSKVETATFMYMFLSFPQFQRAGLVDFDEDQQKELLDFFVQIEPFFDDLTRGLVDSRKKGIYVDLIGNVISSPNDISSDQAESFFLLAFWYHKVVQQIIEIYDTASEEERKQRAKISKDVAKQLRENLKKIRNEV